MSQNGPIIYLSIYLELLCPPILVRQATSGFAAEISVVCWRGSTTEEGTCHITPSYVTPRSATGAAGQLRCALYCTVSARLFSVSFPQSRAHWMTGTVENKRSPKPFSLPLSLLFSSSLSLSFGISPLLLIYPRISQHTTHAARPYARTHART